MTRRLLAVLLWSILAAAFIGPGTVTTAASAGADFGLRLLWALGFSTLACWALQEASARLTILSGRSLGRALRERYPSGWRGLAILTLVCGAILIGCAAYEAGNLLGGVAGAALAVSWPSEWLTLATSALAAALLWFNGPRRVAVVLSCAVAVMGFAFLWTASRVGPSLGELAQGLLRPSLPAGSTILALGLVGTTVVPYNLFLGSGLASGQSLAESRFGIAVAVLCGGAISMGVMIVGATLSGDFAFSALADALAVELGDGARGLFAAGLFAAGLSSAVTAPLAAAMTARALFGDPSDDSRWGETSWRYRCVWLAVLATGVVFGLSGLRPVPVILAAQALNGVLLPVVAVFLFVSVNERQLVGSSSLNGPVSNLILTAVVAVTTVLGVAGVSRAFAAASSRPAPTPGMILLLAALILVVLAFPLSLALRRARGGR